MINVRDLRVDYDHVCAVRDLSLKVAPGEVCGLIGPNGAGKTTTMRALVGLIEPTYGDIEIAGIDMREHPRDACRLIGFMPDFPPLYDDLRCWEFLDLFAASYFVPRARRPAIIDEHLELVGLTEKRDALVVELSRGMRQRLMLAKTLIPDPQVLLLDEPASGMDPQGRIDLKNILKRLGASGKTVLVSSHILAEMTDFCTAMAVMEVGRMVVSGTIDAVRARFAQGLVLVVELLGGVEEFHRLLGADPLVSGIEGNGNGAAFRVHYRGTREQAADLLGRLVQAGVRVASFAPHREGLEELFLKIGAKELA
jgi:ABC-2 type transport system ATP-binding protein